MVGYDKIPTASRIMVGFFTWTAVAVVVAAFAALIQERKLSFDLFNKRFEAYKNLLTTVSFYLDASCDFQDTADSFKELQKYSDKIDDEINDYEFLFSNKIAKQISQLYDIGQVISVKRLRWSKNGIKYASEFERENAKLETAKEEIALFIEERDTLKKMLKPYLKQRTAAEWLYEHMVHLWEKKPFHKRN